MRTGPNIICMNCALLLNACEKTFISMDEIHDTIRRRNFPFCQDLYSLLGTTRKDGMENFSNIIAEAKDEFEEYNDLIIQMQIDNVSSRYTFKDNFIDWLDNKIPMKDVVFKPSAIIQMTSINQSIPAVRAATHWTYDPVTGELFSIWSNFVMHYYAPYPMIAEISPANTEQDAIWTERSGVYLVDNKAHFLDQVSLNILLRIDEYSNAVQLDGFSNPIQVDKAIDRLRTKVENNRSTAEDIYAKWSNR